MRSVTNVSRRTRWGLFGLLLCAAAVPVVAVGFSIRPGIRLRAMTGEMGNLERTLAALPAGGDLEVLSTEQIRLEERSKALDEVMQSLDLLLPHGCDLIELFDDVRGAGRGAGLELQAISPGTTTPLDGSEPGMPVASEATPLATELALLGSGELRDLTEFVQLLRASGHPTEVRSLNLSRESSRSTRFRFQLTLGMQHRSGVAPSRAEDLR